MPSGALWGQLLQQPTKESISPPESERHPKHLNSSKQTQCPTDDNNSCSDTCGPGGVTAPSPLDQCNSRATGGRGGGWPVGAHRLSADWPHLPVDNFNSVVGVKEKSNQSAPPKPDAHFNDDQRCCLQVHSHADHDYYQFWHTTSPHFCHSHAPTKGKLPQ